MARQLVFTSAPRGLSPGRTGLVTVARHRDLDEALVARLERWSGYDRARFGKNRRPEVFALRKWERGGTVAYVLTRIVDAGPDYSGRANHLAHHVIVEPKELPRAPSPAVLALGWKGWFDSWKGGPRWLDEADEIDLGALSLPAAPAPGGSVEGWVEKGHARPGECSYPWGEERGWLAAVAEASRQVDVNAWELTWTTVPQTKDETTFVWRGVPGGPWGFQPDSSARMVRSREEPPWEGRRSERKKSVTQDLPEVEEGGPAKICPERVEGIDGRSSDDGGERGEKKQAWWLWPALIAGVILTGCALWIGAGLFVSKDGKRWAEETQDLMRKGQLAAVEDRLRMVDQGGQVGPEGIATVKAARLWVKAERTRERLRQLREAHDADGVEGALKKVKADPDALELRRASPALVREAEEAMRWLSARREEERSAETAVRAVEQAAWPGNEAALAEARLRLESLRGPEGQRLRERLARWDQAIREKASARKEMVTESVAAEVNAPQKLLRAFSPTSQAGVARWSGSPLSRVITEHLWRPNGQGFEMGVLDSEGRLIGAIPLQVVRTEETVKFYRELDLMLEMRRSSSEGLSWIPATEFLSGHEAGWWFRMEGVEVCFFFPMSPERSAPVQAPLTDLRVDTQAGRQQVKVDGMKLLGTIAVIEGLKVRLDLRVQRGGPITTVRSRAARMGNSGWEEQLAVDLLPEDVVLEGVLIFEESVEGMENEWRLVEFRREKS